MVEAVAASPADHRLELLRAHPELARAPAHEGTMTESSNREQTKVGLDHLNESSQAAFDELNASYRDPFGFPFIIAVRGHDQAGILDAFERRLANGREAEMATALDQVARVARLRLDNLIVGQ